MFGLQFHRTSLQYVVERSCWFWSSLLNRKKLSNLNINFHYSWIGNVGGRSGWEEHTFDRRQVMVQLSVLRISDAFSVWNWRQSAVFRTSGGDLAEWMGVETGWPVFSTHLDILPSVCWWFEWEILIKQVLVTCISSVTIMFHFS